MAVYVDVLLAVNFAVDYLLIKTAALLCGIKINGVRVTLGAVLGAASSLVIFFPGAGAAAQFLYRAAVSLLMCAAAFCPCSAFKLAKTLAAVLASSFLFSGTVLLWQLTVHPTGVLSYAGAVYFDIGVPALIICAAAGYGAACLISRMLRQVMPPQHICEVTVVNNGAAALFTALIDSGSSLVEPFSNSPVIVCERSALGSAAPQSVVDFICKSQPEAGIRLVPYKTLDSSGLLPAFLPEGLTLKTKDGQIFDAGGCYIAVTDAIPGGEYRAICNPRAFSINKTGDEVCVNNS